MNYKQTTALLVAFALALVVMPTSQAQASDEFGSQVLVGDNDFVPTLEDLGDLNAIGCVRHDAGTNDDMTDDVIAIDLADNGAFSQYDLVVFSGAGYDGTATGEIVTDAMDVIEGEGSHSACEAFFIDQNENGFYDEGDWVYLTRTAIETDDPVPNTAATAGGAWTVRLTDTDGGDAGSLVRTGHAEKDWTAEVFEQDDSELGLFDADRDTDFEGGDDGLYLALNAGGNPLADAGGDFVPLNSIRLFGDFGDFGSQVVRGDDDFIPQLEAGNVEAFGCVRHDAGTNDDMTDDVIGISFDVSTGFQQYDLVVFSGGGYDGSETGGIIANDMSLLLDEGNEVTTCEFAVIDADENGFYNAGDWVYLTSGNIGSVALPTTGAAGNSAWTVRITDTDGGDAGSLVRTGHSDRTDWSATDGLTGFDSDLDDLALFDADQDGEFDGGDDMLYLDATGAEVVPDLNDVRLFGDVGEFGSQVGFDDDDFIPTLVDDGLLTATDCIRHDAGTNDQASDDVIAIDMGTGADVFGQYDFVIYSGGYDGSETGAIVTDSMTLLEGDGDDQDCHVVVIDANENGRYDEGDWVYITSDATTGANDALTTTGATETSEWTVRLTDTDGGDAGTLVRTGQTDVTDWTVDFTPAADLAFFDADGDTDFEGGGDWLYLAMAGAGSVPSLFDLRLYGDFEAAGGVPGTTPPTTDPPTTDPPTTDPPTTDPPTTTPPGDDEDPPNGPTPGFELLALVAALGAALVLVRRRS